MKRLLKAMGLRSSIPTARTRVSLKTYRFTPEPRPYGASAAGKRLITRLNENRAIYSELCEDIASYRKYFADTPSNADGSVLPHWRNRFMPPLDGLSLYALLVRHRPTRYIEIGSGNSTKFARKAITDHNLPTKIISVDPSPRAEIDALCDRVIRMPLQSAVDGLLATIQPGDLLFYDGSHHVFTSSDAAVFFTEILPMIPAGCCYGIHDIFLPDDYPVRWFRRFYNEQYLWAAYLAGDPARDRVVFPVSLVGQQPDLCDKLAPVFALPALAGMKPGGGAFWMAKA
jgi:hypothetical protein